MTIAMRMDPRIAARRAAVENEHQRRRTRRTLWLAAVVLAVAVAAVVLQSSLLAVDTVTVEGAVRSDPTVVAEVAGIEEGASLLTLDLADAREAIVALPWVAEVASERSWSGEVVFTVTERTPVAAVAAGQWWAVVDIAGRVLEVHEAPPAGLETVVGVTAPAAPGAWLATRDLAAVAVAARAAGDVVVGAATRSVAVDEQGAVVLDLEQGGRVLMGDDRQLEEKLTAVRTFLLDVELTCMVTLDVRAPSAPVLRRGC
ncbi:MAG: FtsQ-type POTRA domain-containing protein [Acidimicrobiales bacterium]